MGDADLEQALAAAEAAIKQTRPSVARVVVYAAGAAGVAYLRLSTSSGMHWPFVLGAAAFGAGAAWVSAKAAARRTQTDRYLAAFAAARGWVYVPRAPIRLDSRLLAHGTKQRTGHGFAITIAGHRCLLYEHVRI